MKKIINVSLRVILNSLILLMLTIIATLIMYLYNEKKSIETKEYKQPLFSAFIVISGSMIPNIEVNDIIINKSIDVDHLAVGDIISFRFHNNYEKINTHRIVGILENEGKTYFRTKGDNNGVVDNYLVEESLIVGKTILILPKAGYIYLFTKSYMGIGVIILTLIMIYLFTRLYFLLIEKHFPKKNKEFIDEP